MQTLPLDTIRTDGGTQPRAELNFVTIADYADDMQAGAVFPPVVVFYDGADYWLADGFHRLGAARHIGATEISADVRQGSVEDARWFSYGVNRDHGLRRTNDDKRRAVEAALAHPYHARYSNREIARHCGVAESTIRNHRDPSAQNAQMDEPRIVTRNGTTYEMRVENIGRAEPPAVPFVPSAEDYADPYGDEEPFEAWEGEPTIGKSFLADHQRLNLSTSNEWYTPPRFIEAAREVMGRIDLDPASCEYANRVVKALVYYTEDDDGYTEQWHGNVWLNPPYGKDDGDSNQERWSHKLIDEYMAGRVKQAVLLVNAVPGNLWFTPLKDRPICFPDGRIRFYNEETEAGQPTHSNALVYFGPNIAAFVRVFSQFGRVMGPLIVEDGHVRAALS